jgi:hypothetical protein
MPKAANYFRYSQPITTTALILASLCERKSSYDEICSVMGQVMK